MPNSARAAACASSMPYMLGHLCLSRQCVHSSASGSKTLNMNLDEQYLIVMVAPGVLVRNDWRSLNVSRRQCS